MNRIDDDPLLRLRGSGKDLWADEHADEYIRRLREDWDETEHHRENPERQPPSSSDSPTE